MTTYDDEDNNDDYSSEEESANPGTTETDVDCPFCGETFSIVVDTSVEKQTYIEDCFVCCRPISFAVECEDGSLLSVLVDRA